MMYDDDDDNDFFANHICERRYEYKIVSAPPTPLERPPTLNQSSAIWRRQPNYEVLAALPRHSPVSLYVPFPHHRPFAHPFPSHSFLPLSPLSYHHVHAPALMPRTDALRLEYLKPCHYSV